MNLLYSTGGVKIWPIMKSLYSVFATVGAGESALVAGARWQNRELDFHDWLVMTGECVSRCHELSRWCVTQCCRHVLWICGRHTTKNGPISPDNYSQLVPNCEHFSRVLKTSDHLCSHTLKIWLVCSKNQCTQTVALIYENSVSYIWFTAWDGIPALVVRSNYKPAFWPGLNFYHRWVLSVLI